MADIDLRIARTVDDVLRAINNNTSASVTAAVDGDRLVLTDTSGGSGNLKVQDIGTGKTALDLGLAGINVAANTATGADVFQLHAGTKLDVAQRRHRRAARQRQRSCRSRLPTKRR